MSQDDITKCSNILKDILNPNNEARNLAVSQLEVMRQNTPVLLFCLLKILSESQDKTEKTVSAVLIRKILEITDDMIYSPHWKNLNSNENFFTIFLSSYVKKKQKMHPSGKICYLGGKRSCGSDLTSDGSQVHVLNLIGIKLGRHGCRLGFLNFSFNISYLPNNRIFYAIE